MEGVRIKVVIEEKLAREHTYEVIVHSSQVARNLGLDVKDLGDDWEGEAIEYVSEEWENLDLNPTGIGELTVIDKELTDVDVW